MKLSKYSVLTLLLLACTSASALPWAFDNSGETTPRRNYRAKTDTILVGLPDSVALEDFDSLQVRSSRYERIVRRYHNFWMGMVPSQIKVQYAGSIGLFSIGMGWHYGGHEHRKWETDLQFGYLPRYHRRTGNFILTARESFIPFRVRLGDDLDIEPLSCGLFFSNIFGEEYWREQPSRYPRKYYGFSTSTRANVFVGQRLRFAIPSSVRKRNNSITAYYELSTSELDIISFTTNRWVTLWDILSLSLGIKFDLF